MVEVVAALVWQNDKFLIAQRPPHKARGLKWEFVGGKVEKGETDEDALKRELKEELDVDISVGEKFLTVVHEYEDITVKLSVYNASVVGGTIKLLEHCQAKYIGVGEMDDYEFCDADDEILSAIKNLPKN